MAHEPSRLLEESPSAEASIHGLSSRCANSIKQECTGQQEHSNARGVESFWKGYNKQKKQNTESHNSPPEGGLVRTPSSVEALDGWMPATVEAVR